VKRGRRQAGYFEPTDKERPAHDRIIHGGLFSMDLYIYYHAAPADAAAVQAAVLQLQQQLRARLAAARTSASASASASAPALRCGLKRRPPTVDHARDTWMEIYLAVADDFPSLLTDAVAGSPLASLIDGSRHVEIFVEALPCA
jgi:hypothetical protein